MGNDSSNAKATASRSEPGMLKLPSDIRVNIFERLLRVPHPLYIFQDPGSPVELFAPDRPFRWNALLRLSREIGQEAAGVLYGTNTFHFMDITDKQADLVEQFLEAVGPVNAGFVKRVCIDFPVVVEEVSSTAAYRLPEHTLRILQLLGEKCRRLEAIEMHVHERNSNDFAQADEDDAALLEKKLSTLDVHLKSIPSLKKIVVNFSFGTPAPSARRAMHGLGWEILPSIKFR